MSPTRSDIFLDSPSVLAQVARLEQVAESLHVEALRYQEALHAAAQGDPRGYLSAGIDDGHAALTAARRAEAEIREVIRRMRATVDALVQHDAGASDAGVPAPPRTLPAGTPITPIKPMPLDGFLAASASAAGDAVDVLPDVVPTVAPPFTPLMPEPELVSLEADTFVSTPTDIDDISATLHSAEPLPILDDDVVLEPLDQLRMDQIPAELPEISDPPLDDIVLAETEDVAPVVFLSAAPSAPPTVPPSAPPDSRDHSWWERIKGWFAGMLEWIMDLISGVWELAKLYFGALADGNWITWAVTIIVVVVVVILALIPVSLSIARMAL